MCPGGCGRLCPPIPIPCPHVCPPLSPCPSPCPQDTFERVFSVPGLRDLPWFVLAGNHDHAGNVTAQMAYGRHSPRWYGQGDMGTGDSMGTGTPAYRWHSPWWYRQGDTGTGGQGTAWAQPPLLPLQGSVTCPCPQGVPQCPHTSPVPAGTSRTLSAARAQCWGVPGVSRGSPRVPCPRRHFPHYFYSLRLSLPGTNASARLLLLDTVLLCGGGDDAGGAPAGPGDAAAAAAQLRWLRRRLAAARGDRFVLLAGHYPLWSAGEHGPSGCLRRLLRPLLRRHRATAYLSGHDHNLQVRAGPARPHGDPEPPHCPLNPHGTPEPPH